MMVPAFSYLYTKQNYPARGILAWAALGGGRWCRSRAVNRLAQLFQISKVNARILLHRGDGIFWRLTRRNVHPYSKRRLWSIVASESAVPENEYIGVPEEILVSISQTRAYLATPVLTRGPNKPVSLATSAQLLGRGKRAVTTYRNHLARRGCLQTIPQYERLREQKLTLKTPPLEAGEFIKKGWIYRRTADIVVLKNGLGEILTWPVHQVKKRTMEPRRYFINTKQLEGWIARGHAVAKDAVVRIFEDWVSVANVLSGVYGEANTNTKNLYHAQNIRPELVLVKPPRMAYSNGQFNRIVINQ